MKTRTPTSNPISYRYKVPVRLTSLLTALTMILSPAAGYAAPNPQFQVCVPHVSDQFTPPNFGVPPLIDGVVASDSDLGWAGSFRYVDGNPNVMLENVAVQWIRDDTNLYLSVEANNTTPLMSGAPDPQNVVVVALDPDNTGTKMQRFVIYPVENGAQNGKSKNVRVFKTWSNKSSSADVSGENDNQFSLNNPIAGAGPNPINNCPPTSSCVQADYEGASWSLEMKLHITGDQTTGINIPANGTFGIYVDVLRVVTGQWAQSSWPPNAPEAGCTSVQSCFVEADTPPETSFGTATIDPTLQNTCNGVSLNSQVGDIYVSNLLAPNPPPANQPGNTLIAAFSDNVFHARVHNSAPAGNIPLTVSATYFIANFGVPDQSSWQQIGTTGNTPIPPGTVVNPSVTTLDSSPPFKPSNPNDYDPNVKGSHPHQCIMVKLDSPQANGTFTNSTAVQNMDFVHASKVERRAEISAKGYPLPAGQTDQVFDLVLSTKEEVRNPCKDRGAVATPAAPKVGAAVTHIECQVTSRLTWTIQACRHTGQFLSSQGGSKFELCDPVGSFGYLAEHVGETPANWQQTFVVDGKKPEKVPGTTNGYRVHVPKDGVATVTTTIEAKEGKFAVLLDLGGAFPQPNTTFSSLVNAGFGLNGGLEYMFHPRFSAEGVFGYHHFPVKIAGDVNIIQFSANVKAYVYKINWPVRLFFNGGIGGYHFTSGTTNFGGNVGVGVLWQSKKYPHWGLQTSYNFHAVNTPVEATKFSTAQGGFRYVFSGGPR